MKQVSWLFTSSLRYLLFLEIVFKLLGVFIVLPLAGGILQVALRFSDIHYIAAQNYQQAFTQPLLIVAMVLIVILVIAYLSFEVSCITISYQQAYFGHPISYYQLLKESMLKTVKLWRPSNWLLIPFSIFMLPTLFYFLQNSSNAYIKAIQHVVEDLSTSFPTNLIVISCFVITLIIAIIGMFAYQFYISQSISGWRAVTASFRLMKNHWKRVCTGILLWMLLLGAALMLFHVVVYLLIRLGTYLLVVETTRHAVMLTIYYYAKNLINFISYSMLSFGWFGYVASSYYRYTRMHPHMSPKPIARKKDPRAKRRGGITLGMLTGFVVLTLLTNIIMVRSVDDTWETDLWDDKMSIMAHRGASSDYPENTLDAFWEAVNQQADFIELDCQLSSDGFVIVNHDVNLKRCWDVNANVGDLTLEEIKQIYDKDGRQIPTLAEVFEVFKEESIDFNVELKASLFSEPQSLAQAVMDVISYYEMQERCVIQSFDYDCLVAVKEIDESMECGYILTTAAGQFYNLESADFFSMNIAFVTDRAVTSAHLRNKRILVWTVNSEKRLEEAIDLKVDGVITDVPIYAREIIYGAELPLEEILEEEIFPEAEHETGS